MRFNLTGETYLPEMVSNFPEAPNMTFAGMIVAALFLSMIPIGISFLTYFFIYLGFQKMFGRTTTTSLLLTGFVLTLTTPVIYILSGGYQPFVYKASTYAWVFTFVISTGTYYWLNKKDKTQGRFGA